MAQWDHKLTKPEKFGAGCNRGVSNLFVAGCS